MLESEKQQKTALRYFLENNLREAHWFLSRASPEQFYLYRVGTFRKSPHLCDLLRGRERNRMLDPVAHVGRK